MEFTAPGVPQIGSVIRGKEPATSISFHADGVHLFVASEADQRLRLIDCQKGTSDVPSIRCEREGIHLVEATHHPHCTLFSGKGARDQPLTQRHAIHYHSFYDNKILRKFRGHAGLVTDISMSPADDCFLSSSDDRTVRLWNLQQASCLAEMELPSNTHGTPRAVYDSTGLVFGITAAMTGGDGQYVHLYDARNYTAGAFAELKVSQSSIEGAIRVQQGTLRSTERAIRLSKLEWTSMAFNASGNQILVTGNDGLALVLDGFEGTIQRALCSEGAVSACFTSDEKTVLTGNDDGTISCWNVGTGSLMKKLEGHTGRVGCIASNPKFSMFASCCTNTALWIW